MAAGEGRSGPCHLGPRHTNPLHQAPWQPQRVALRAEQREQQQQQQHASIKQRGAAALTGRRPRHPWPQAPWHVAAGGLAGRRAARPPGPEGRAWRRRLPLGPHRYPWLPACGKNQREVSLAGLLGGCRAGSWLAAGRAAAAVASGGPRVQKLARPLAQGKGLSDQVESEGWAGGNEAPQLALGHSVPHEAGHIEQLRHQRHSQG